MEQILKIRMTNKIQIGSNNCFMKIMYDSIIDYAINKNFKSYLMKMHGSFAFTLLGSLERLIIFYPFCQLTYEWSTVI